MKVLVALACFLAIANARTLLLPTSQGFSQPSGYLPGAIVKPAYPVRPAITRPSVVEVEEPVVVIGEEVEDEAPLPCNPNVIGVVVHDEEEQAEEVAPVVIETKPLIVKPVTGGSVYPVINRPSVGQQQKPAVYPVYPTQQRPAITPTGPVVQQRPSITPVGPQIRPAITPVGPQIRPAIVPARPQTKPAIIAVRPQTKPAIRPTGPLTRPAIPEQPAPCVLPEQEIVEEEEVVIVETRPQSKPQILPAVLPSVSINTRPAIQEEELAPVAMVVENDGELRPVYDWIR